VARVCQDMLRSRTRRGEESLDKPRFEPVAHAAADPEQESLLAESIGLALLVVLDRLDPPERLAFVLHDMFGITFDEIASVVGRSPAAARQLACRARRRVRATTTVAKPDLIRQREVVDNFLTALPLCAAVTLKDFSQYSTQRSWSALTRLQQVPERQERFAVPRPGPSERWHCRRCSNPWSLSS